MALALVQLTQDWEKRKKRKEEQRALGTLDVDASSNYGIPVVLTGRSQYEGCDHPSRSGPASEA